MDFKHVPNAYRPIPFWSWNERLETKETRRQVREMQKAGLGGFFMHARGGLQNEYMGEEWFDNITAAVEESKKVHTDAWAYDEHGWPSGFCGGKVNGLGLAYQQKFLRMEETLEHTETAICKNGTHYFYYDVNPYYVDVLDKKVIAAFITYAYEPYFEKYGNQIRGFFTDEPQISREGIPWSFVMEEAYQTRYGENLLEHLEELFICTGDFQKTRVQFWKMVTELFAESYMKQIYEWCDARGLELTGHLVLEDTMETQLTTNGACMPQYEYMHIPGMDWLGREIGPDLIPLQVSSIAEQTGKKAVISETFALCGHNVNFAELKGLYEWQMVHGINMLCQHLEGYSLRGLRKRDYPPAMYLQQPWWQEYHRFNEAMAREGMILQNGSHEVDVLLLHPQTSAWAVFTPQDTTKVKALDQTLRENIQMLQEKHIEFHMGDEISMERHARVENGALVIGTQSYHVIVDPGCQVLLAHTKQLLKEFQQAGGKIVTAAELDAHRIIDRKDITYTKRTYEDFYVHFFVNTSAERKCAKIFVKGQALDMETGELQAFDGEHEFEPWGSLMVIEFLKEEKNAVSEHNTAVRTEKTYIRPQGTYQITEAVQNSLTLDRCDYYFDGILQEKQCYVLNICERANELGRAVALHQDYHVKAEYIPDPLYLVCETPEKFTISVNGVEVVQNIEGSFVDQSFCKIDIAKYMQVGENIISFDCILQQSEECYESRQKSKTFASERHKLVYDMEIEAIYLVGDFSVKTEGTWTKLEKKAVRYHGDFVLDAPKKEVQIKHMEQQGYPFFCGHMTLEGTLDICGEHPVLDIDWRGINVLCVEINGKKKVMWKDAQLSLEAFDVQGSVPVKFTLYNNLRNLLGPHHRPEGELYAVEPATFCQEPCPWTAGRIIAWHDDYCFVEMGL